VDRRDLPARSSRSVHVDAGRTSTPDYAGGTAPPPPLLIGGCVGRAVAGTLFFDEVAALGPLGQQRVMDLARDRAGRTVVVQVPLDVRVVAATTRDLKQEVATGHFRRDLSDISVRSRSTCPHCASERTCP
jgi:hypothetical protein